MAIGLVFLITALASFLITRGVGVGEVISVDVRELETVNPKSGQLFNTRGHIELVEFNGLDMPPVMVISSQGTEVQAVIQDQALRERVLGQTDHRETGLLPDHKFKSQGRKDLGRFRIIGQMETIPVRHMRIRALSRG